MPLAYRIGTGASMDRLESLIEERLKPGADTKKIDSRIWDLFGEEWAIMFTDLSGFSRQVAEFGIIHFLQMIYESHRLLVPCIDDHDGIRHGPPRIRCAWGPHWNTSRPGWVPGSSPRPAGPVDAWGGCDQHDQSSKRG